MNLENLDQNQTLALGIFVLCLPCLVIMVGIFIKYVLLKKNKKPTNSVLLYL